MEGEFEKGTVFVSSAEPFRVRLMKLCSKLRIPSSAMIIARWFHSHHSMMIIMNNNRYYNTTQLLLFECMLLVIIIVGVTTFYHGNDQVL